MLPILVLLVLRGLILYTALPEVGMGRSVQRGCLRMTQNGGETGACSIVFTTPISQTLGRTPPFGNWLSLNPLIGVLFAFVSIPPPSPPPPLPPPHTHTQHGDYDAGRSALGRTSLLAPLMNAAQAPHLKCTQ